MKRVVLVAVIGSVLLAGCGGGADPGAPEGQPKREQATVSVKQVEEVGKVLVDGQGSTLYVNDADRSGTIRCVSACAEAWPPLTLPQGVDEPVAGHGVSAAKLGVATRPDGRKQITANGRPLYRFSGDGAPGTVTGDRVRDRFGDTTFAWTVATPSGTKPTKGGTQPGDGY